MRRPKVQKDIELRQLRSFTLAATQGGFSAAAAALGLSVPAVWEQVRSLESTLGAMLLVRQGRAVELTVEGKLLLEIIHPHVSGLDSLVKLFQARRSESARQLSVASIPQVLANLLPPPIQEFMAKHGETQLRLLSDPGAATVMRMVERGEADLGLITANPDEPASPHLAYEYLFDLKFMLLTSSNHPLARKKEVKAGDLVKYPIITMLASSPNRKLLERILRRHDLLDRLHVVMENSSTDIIQKYVALGAGISLLYAWSRIDRHAPGLHMREFDPHIETLPVMLVTRKFAHLPDHVQKFLQILRKHLADSAPNHL
jgi:LysR family cyn operon transcriptional activator